MTARCWFILGVGLVTFAALGRAPGQGPAGSTGRTSGRLVVTGKTQPAPGRVAFICPLVVDPVKEVLVRQGDRVQKGQVLLKHDNEEAVTKVKAKEAVLKSLEASLTQIKMKPHGEETKQAEQALEKARFTLKTRKRDLQRMQGLWEKGAVPEKTCREARLAYEKAQIEERSAASRLQAQIRQPLGWQIAEAKAKVAEAKAELEAAEEALQDFRLKARIAGVVTELRAGPGLTARPGTAVWGKIVDVSELDVRCDLAPGQARGLKVGQPARVRDESDPGAPLRGRVAVVGVVADPGTGRVPVLVRVANPDGRLFCYVPVKVEFGAAFTSR